MIYGQNRVLTLSPPIPLRFYTLPRWFNPPFLIFDIRALWRSRLSARAPECQKLKMAGQTSMALNPSNSSNFERLALKGLTHLKIAICCMYIGRVVSKIYLLKLSFVSQNCYLSTNLNNSAAGYNLFIQLYL